MTREAPFSITPTLDKLLRGTLDMPYGLFQLPTMTAEQLRRALGYKPGCIKAIKARLKLLADNGFVQMDSYPVKHIKNGKAYFSPKYYYTLSNKGVRYLKEAGLNVNDAFRASKEMDKHALFVEHALELNDVIISAALVKGLDNGFFLYNFIHERTLRRRPYKATWRGNGRVETHTIIPDAFLDFRNNEMRRRLPVLLEHDRGTEAQHYFRRRIRAYIAFIQDQAARKLFDAGMITIAFTTFAGEFRLAQMRQWARQELAPFDRAIAGSFYFADLTRPPDPYSLWFGPSWRSPYGDDTQRYCLLPLENTKDITQ